VVRREWDSNPFLGVLKGFWPVGGCDEAVPC
jgi:hypothetical protein